MTEFDTIRYEVADGVATLTLNRPDRINEMTNRMVREADDALELAAQDTSMRVLVLTGAGTSFCPGADLQASRAAVGRRAAGPPTQFRSACAAARPCRRSPSRGLNGACAAPEWRWAGRAHAALPSPLGEVQHRIPADVAVAGDMALPCAAAATAGRRSKARGC